MVRVKALFLTCTVLVLTLLATSGTISVASPRTQTRSALIQQIYDWVPWGPQEDNATIKIYSNATAEETAFSNGQIDIPDIPVSSVCQKGNPDVSCWTQNYAALAGWDYALIGFPTPASLVPGLPQNGSVCDQGLYSTGCGFWSLLDMNPTPPSQNLCNTMGQPITCTHNATFFPGGGNRELIRRGITGGTISLNPLRPVTRGDLEVISLIYDTMVRLNPFTNDTGGPSHFAEFKSQYIYWMITNNSTIFDPTANTTTQTWRLRPDLFWSDGQQLTPADVCYSIQAYQLVPTSYYGSKIPAGTNCTTNGSNVQVTIPGFNLTYSTRIGTLPIIPMHIWSLYCGLPPRSGAPCASLNFDPIALGIEVGSGPWVCNPSTGISTIPGQTSCTQQGGSPGTQQLSAGGTIHLHRYDLSTNGFGYMRCCPNEQGSSLHKFSWADADNDGCVGIGDISWVALNWQKHSGYWDSPLFGLGQNEKVDIGELSTAALYFFVCLTAPYRPANLVSLNPNVNPFLLTTYPLKQSYFFIGIYNIAPGVAEAELNGTLITGFTATLHNCTPDCATGTTISSASGSVETIPFPPFNPPDEIVFTSLTYPGPGHYAIEFSYTGSSLPPYGDRYQVNLP